MNYFALFEIPVSLKVDSVALLKKYYALSKQFHPDNFTLADTKLQEESERTTSTIHAAKKVLDNPYKRLEYILREQQIIQDEEKYSLSPMFLGEMMDINEQLMELEFEKNEHILATLKKEIEEKEQELFMEVQRYFEMDVLELNEADYPILKEYYYKKKYLQRIAEKLK